MSLSADFLTATESLRVPLMGTDSIASLLYYLLRWLRSQRVIEVGMGYTTPFIAQALHDNALDFYREQEVLSRKIEKLGTQGDPHSFLTRAKEEWFSEDLPLARATYYKGHFEVKLISIDDLSISESAASQVAKVLKQLNLLSTVELHTDDYHTVRSKIPSSADPFDFIWVDCDQSVFIFDDYWNLLGKGGLFVIHSLLTDRGGDIALRYILDTLAASNIGVEVLNLFEPHKLYQSGVTLLRRLD